jgi:hypothetical protein
MGGASGLQRGGDVDCGWVAGNSVTTIDKG